MPDAQLLATGTSAAPLDYEVPGNITITPKYAFAHFDGTSAGVAWFPAVQVISDSGHTVATIPTGASVAAGAAADATWAPFLRSQAASTLSPEPSDLLAASAHALLLASGVLGTFTFQSGTFAPGAPQLFTGLPPAGQPFVLTWASAGTAAFTVVVTWPAAAYDRYVQVAVANPFDPTDYSNPLVVRGSLSPDSDVQTLSFLIGGNPGPPATTATFQAFQASGVNRTPLLQMMALAIPTILA